MGRMNRQIAAGRLKKLESKAYLERAYQRPVDFALDIAALCKLNPGVLQRRSKLKTSVFNSLANAVKAVEIAWLMNACVFIRDNPAIQVPFGTTANEAAHARLKGAFWNVPKCNRAYVHRFSTAFTTRTLVQQRLGKLWSCSSSPSQASDRAVTQMALELLAREPPAIGQPIGDSTWPKRDDENPRLSRHDLKKKRRAAAQQTPKKRQPYQPKRKYK